ncbi:MAG: heme NO-binding protein [Alphaproteobacteria bacterium]|nr:MAG: heme NO-binding protein [Alphaproteobacteria bacterium]
MHGLINRSIQLFLGDTYGTEAWQAIVARAGLGIDSFEAMLTYPAEMTTRLLQAAAAHLGKAREQLLEDLGTYLVSHPRMEAVRRLLRYGGESFVDFLHSLDELPDRARLAVPDLEMPELELLCTGVQAYALEVRFERPGFGHVLQGVLRAMADDYGALVTLEHAGAGPGSERLIIEVLETAFAQGRGFELAARAM